MTDWVPGIVALVGGLGAGASALMWSKRKGAPKPAQDDKLIALEAQAATLVEQLRELNADKHQYDEASFTAEKTRLERAAADALKSRDARKVELNKAKGGKEKVAPTPKRDTWASRHPQLIGALWGAGTVAFFWVAITIIGAEPGAEAPAPRSAVVGTNDPRYEALLVLSSIAISVGDVDKTIQFWQGYMMQPEPRRRPPMLQKAYDFLEEALNHPPAKEAEKKN